MFEVGEVSEEIAREALRLASHKLPIKTKFDEIVAVINGLGAKIKFEKKITPKYVQNILKEIVFLDYDHFPSNEKLYKARSYEELMNLIRTPNFSKQ